MAFLYVRGSRTQLIGGRGSRGDVMITAAGAVDVGAEIGITGFTPITAEAMVAASPDVVVVPQAGLESVGGVDGLLRLPGVSLTPAGRNRRILAFDDQYILGLGPRTGRALRDLISALHRPPSPAVPLAEPRRAARAVTAAVPAAPPRLHGAGIARRVRPWGVLAGLAALLPLAVVVGVTVGAYAISPAQVVAILAERLAGIDLGVAHDPQQDAVLWSIRLPRVVLGALVGAALGVAGAALQGVFRNPLADPGVVGVASGASLGATAAIVLGFGALGTMSLPVAAFAGALAAALVVYGIARRDGRTEVVTLILTGLAIVAIVESFVGLLTSVADDDQLRDLTFWRLGSLGGASWDGVGTIAPIVAATVLLTPLLARPLDLMSLGEREAAHLGVDTERVRAAAIVLAALGVGAAVAMAGVIVFVGLVVPHMVRLAAGPRHRVLLPGSALGGASLLVCADVIARTVAAPVEVPLGVVTGLIGGPFFLWLLFRTRRAQGGWG